MSLSGIKTWTQFYEYGCKAGKFANVNVNQVGRHPVSSTINDKVSIFKGDIVKLEFDAIVNAANSSLRGGGGVDGAIHRAAGRNLLEECKKLNHCATGNAVITKGYNLKAKHVIHTVGPQNGDETLLRSCYRNSLKLALDNGLKTVAFPCIATGIYGYPNKDAANAALDETRKFLDEHHNHFDRIVFCLFTNEDEEAYIEYLPIIYPIPT